MERARDDPARRVDALDVGPDDHIQARLRDLRLGQRFGGHHIDPDLCDLAIGWRRLDENLGRHLRHLRGPITDDGDVDRDLRDFRVGHDTTSYPTSRSSALKSPTVPHAPPLGLVTWGSSMKVK